MKLAHGAYILIEAEKVYSIGGLHKKIYSYGTYTRCMEKI
jgi:hypothetical protein